MSEISDLRDRVIALTNRLNAIGANSKTNEELPPFSPFNRNALVRGSVSGVSKTFKIQDLIDEVANELALGNVPVIFIPVTINFNTPATTQAKIIEQLNLMANYSLQQGTLYIPYVQRIVLSNGGSTIGNNYAVVTEYYFLTQRIDPDIDGNASIGVDGTEILSDGVRYFNTVDNRSFAPIDFNLGDIGSDLISVAVNTSGPFSTPNGTTVIFYATQDGEERVWLYRGMQEEVGLTKPPTVEQNFRLFPAQSETDPPPTFQETTPQASTSLSNITLFLDNHEKRFIKMENAFYQSTFTSRRLRLGGASHALIDTTGQTEYPTILNKWLVKMNTSGGTANIMVDSHNYLIEQDTETAYGMENDFVSTHAAAILSDTGMTVIFNNDGFLEFDGSGSHTITIANLTGALNGSVKAVPAVLVNTYEFTEGLYDFFAEYDGVQVSYWFKKRIINGTDDFVFKEYTDITDLKTHQSEQKENALYYVTDASDDENITFPAGETKLQATYRYKGVANGDIGDYELLSVPYGNYVALGETSSTAYRGDRGKTAYDHSQSAHAPVNATVNDTDANLRNRATHTGTQLAATISDFFAQVRATVLTGISFVTDTAVTATDTILQAIGKLQAQVTINNAKVTNATHTGDVTGATALTIANKAVTNAKLADVATAIIKGRKTAGTGAVEDLSAADVRTLLNVEDGAQKNVKPSWTAPVGDPKEIENKPSQLNFSIYNQNKTNKKVISTTTKSSIIVATTGVKSVPSYALNDSFIGRVFGFFDNGGTARTVQVFFTIGNREYSTSITATETDVVPFQIDYAINFPVAREANISGIIRVGAASKAIDLDFDIITGLDFDIQTTLSGGTLTINSSYLHRNYNG